MRRPRPKPGFTLLELLVVVGILAVLLSILIPVIGKARQQALTVSCLANERQLVLACEMYASDYHDTLPYTGFLDPVPSVNWAYHQTTSPPVLQTTDAQGGQLWPYVKSLSFYHCPLETGPWAPGSVQNVTTYVMNGALSGFGNPGNKNVGLDVKQFHPDDIFFWEFPSFGTNMNGGNDATNYPVEGVAVRHNGGTCVAHADGHVEVMPFSQFNALCQYGANMLWCSPIAADGGFSKGASWAGGTVPNPIPAEY